MSDSTDLAAAIGQCVQAVAAVVGLGAIWWQVREARKTSDIQSLQSFLHDAKEHENALLHPQSAEAQPQAFVEYLNFLEVYAAAFNKGLLPQVSAEFVRDKIIDSVVAITEAEPWHDKLDEAVTSDTTFKYLREFMRRQKADIAKAISARAALLRQSA